MSNASIIGTSSVTAGTSAIPIVGAQPAAGPSVPLSGVPIIGVQPSAGSNSGGSSDGDNRGLDQKWGDPLSTGLYDSDGVHAGVSYFYDAGRYGGQGGLGLSLTIKN